MRTIFCISAVLLGGCTTSSEVIPIGRDTYMLNGAAYGFVAGTSTIAASKAANDYCAKQQRFLIIRNTQSSGDVQENGEHTQLVFSCVTADDPEYTRRDLRPDNGVTTIQVR